MKNSSEKPRSISDLKTASMATDGGLARGSLTTSFFGQVGQAKDPYINSPVGHIDGPMAYERKVPEELTYTPRH